jgi:hypothetical protein
MLSRARRPGLLTVLPFLCVCTACSTFFHQEQSELRRSLPDVQVIIKLHQQLIPTEANANGTRADTCFFFSLAQVHIWSTMCFCKSCTSTTLYVRSPLSPGSFRSVLSRSLSLVAL